MSMSMSAPIGAPKAKPIKLETCTPGSVVELTSADYAGPIQGTVMRMESEYGPTSIPALWVKPDGGSDEILVTATGRVNVRLVMDAAEVFGTEVPAAAELCRRIPKQAVALQFTGGAQSATQIVQWGAGHVGLAYMADDGRGYDYLTVRAGGGESELRPGGWLVKEDDQWSVVGDDQFSGVYERLDKTNPERLSAEELAIRG